MVGKAGLDSLKFSLYVASIAMILMVFFIILFVAYYQRKQAEQRFTLQEMEAEMQRRLLENSLETQEVERHRIAKDLHDDIGAMLSATKMSLKQLSKKINGSDEILLLVNRTNEMLEESIGQVRRISKELVPNTLEGFGLEIALDEFIQKIQLVSDIYFEFQCENILPNERFDRKVELTIYRIAQELVNNALKHAEAKNVTLTLYKAEKDLIFIFTDDGKGFNLEETMNNTKSGLGLRNIQSRLSVVSGKLSINSVQGVGTTTQMNIPIAKA